MKTDSGKCNNTVKFQTMKAKRKTFKTVKRKKISRSYTKDQQLVSKKIAPPNLDEDSCFVVMIITSHPKLVLNLFKCLSKSNPLSEPNSISHSLLNTDQSGADLLQRNYYSTDDGNKASESPPVPELHASFPKFSSLLCLERLSLNNIALPYYNK